MIFFIAYQSILASYPINSNNIKIFDIEQDPDMQEIQAYMDFLTGGRTVRNSAFVTN